MVSQSVLASEVQALENAFESADLIHKAMKKLIAWQTALKVLADSRTLFYVIEEDSCTRKRKFQTDIHALRERYGTSELRRVG